MGLFGVTPMVLFGIVISLQSANAFECYRCNPSNSDCNDPFNKNAGVSTIQCSGSCYKLKGEKSGDQGVERGCQIESDNKCDERTVLGVKFQMCTCTSNLCNGVLPVRGSFIALVASIVICLILY